MSTDKKIKQGFLSVIYDNLVPSFVTILVRLLDYVIRVVKQPDKLFFDIRDFLFNNGILVICIYFYYRLCVNFLTSILLVS